MMLSHGKSSRDGVRHQSLRGNMALIVGETYYQCRHGAVQLAKPSHLVQRPAWHFTELDEQDELFIVICG